MSAKPPPVSGLQRDEVLGLSTLRQENTHRLLKRIANAVQVSPSAFYGPPNAVDAATPSASGFATSGASEAEVSELLAAFDRIRDPGDRRRLLELVRERAERG